MEAYTVFAGVYDILMDDTPYEAWAERICGCLRESGIADGLVLELGCGTGTLTQLLSKAGYEMIGVDNSPEMLEEAVRKRTESGEDILYLQQEMQSFELYGTVRAVVCACDSLNYLLSEEELVQCFRLVNNYLDPGGLFLFDFNTVHKYRDLIGDTVIAENREECSFIWENGYDEESGLNEYDLTLFIRESQEGLYRKHTETHFQRGYTLEEVKDCLKASGMEFMAAYDDYGNEAANAERGRILVIAKEKGKG